MKKLISKICTFLAIGAIHFAFAMTKLAGKCSDKMSEHTERMKKSMERFKEIRDKRYAVVFSVDNCKAVFYRTVGMSAVKVCDAFTALSKRLIELAIKFCCES